MELVCLLLYSVTVVVRIRPTTAISPSSPLTNGSYSQPESLAPRVCPQSKCTWSVFEVTLQHT